LVYVSIYQQDTQGDQGGHQHQGDRRAHGGSKSQETPADRRVQRGDRERHKEERTQRTGGNRNNGGVGAGRKARGTQHQHQHQHRRVAAYSYYGSATAVLIRREPHYFTSQWEGGGKTSTATRTRDEPRAKGHMGAKCTTIGYRRGAHGAGRALRL
jgi:hypothetical protein